MSQGDDPTDPDADSHWLWRLDSQQWLDAARVELALVQTSRSQRRRALTHARRAAGMAINAWLRARVQADEPADALLGRSYVEHLRGVASLTRLASAATGETPAREGPTLPREATAGSSPRPYGDPRLHELAGLAETATQLLALPLVSTTAEGFVRLSRSAGADVDRGHALAGSLIDGIERGLPEVRAR